MLLLTASESAQDIRSDGLVAAINDPLITDTTSGTNQIVFTANAAGFIFETRLISDDNGARSKSGWIYCCYRNLYRDGYTNFIGFPNPI